MAENPQNTPSPPAAEIATNDDNDRHLDTSAADRKVVLMKCPTVVSRAMQHHRGDQPPSPSSSDAGSSSVVGKIILSVDLLSNTAEYTMELAGNENAPKRYSMNDSTNDIPLSVFSKSSKGKLSVEGEIAKKFDMNPHSEHLKDYAKLCRDRMEESSSKKVKRAKDEDASEEK